MVVKKYESTRTSKNAGVLRLETSNLERLSISKSSSMVSLTQPIISEAAKARISNSRFEVEASLSTANFDNLLDAVSVICRQSKLLCSECLFAGWITNILGDESTNDARLPSIVSWKDGRTGVDGVETQKSTSNRQSVLHNQEFPPLSSTAERVWNSRQPNAQNQQSHLPTSHYPPQSETVDPPLPPRDSQPSLQYTGESEADPESPLIPWLIRYVREEKDPLNRLMTINLLTDFVRAGCVSKARVKVVSLLIVPILVSLLDDSDGLSYSSRKFSRAGSKAQDVQLKIRERAPLILANLVTDSPEMQKVAVDAGAVKRLSLMLKRTYDDGSASDDEEDNPNASTTYEGNYIWLEKCREHTLRVREATLKAFAAIALFEDEYRAQIIESGAMTYVKKSLKPASTSSGDDVNAKGPASSTPVTSRGNPEAVLVAATATIRSLSRSVKILSTSLIDSQICEPLCELLTYPSMRVRIATTAAMANLAMSFSPLRKILIERNIITTMCHFIKGQEGDEGCNGIDMSDKEKYDESKEALRLEALWTLKHIVTQIDEETKTECLERLDAKWIVRLIDRDPNDITIPTVTQDTVMLDDDRANDGTVIPSTSHTSTQDGIKALESHDIPFSPPVLNRLASQWHPQNSQTNARKSLIDLQEQALDLIRNLVITPASTPMINLLLKHNANFFDVLCRKLASNPPPQTIHSIVYILVNISASENKHRMMLIEKKDLIKEINKLFDCPLNVIRSGLAWLAINLTWAEDNGDREDARKRVKMLRELGFISALEGLRNKINNLENGGVESSGSTTTTTGGGNGSGAAGSTNSVDYTADGGGGSGHTATSLSSSSNVFVGGGESSLLAAAHGRISLDVRERCKQALSQIEQHSRE